MTTTDARVLDARVAEFVIGPPWDVGTEWRVNTSDHLWERLDSQGRVDHVRAIRGYSTNIAAALEVADAMIAKGWAIMIRGGGSYDDWQVEFDNGSVTVEAWAPALPEAICRAALAVMEGE